MNILAICGAANNTNPRLKHEHMGEDFRAVAKSGREA